MPFIEYIAAAGGGGPTYPPGGTTSELIPSTGTRSTFGSTIAVAGDNSTVAVGDNGALKVWIFTDPSYSGAWPQESRIDAPGGYSEFGSVALGISDDGNTLAVVGATGGSRVVRIYTRSAGTYSHQQTITVPANIVGAWLISAVALDSTGDRLAVGAANSSDANGTTGTLHIYKRTAGTWALEVDKTGVVEDLDYSGSFLGAGYTLSFSAAGDRLAVCHPYIGYVEVLVRSGTTWTSEYFVNWDACTTVRLNSDGDKLVSISNYINNASFPHHYATRSGSTWTAAGTFLTSGKATDFNPYTVTPQHGAALAGDSSRLLIGYGFGHTNSSTGAPNQAGRVLTFNSSFTEGTAVTNPGSTAGLSYWGGAVDISDDAVLFAAAAQNESAGRAWVRYL